jgi:hypothetical protein
MTAVIRSLVRPLLPNGLFVSAAHRPYQFRYVHDD